MSALPKSYRPLALIGSDLHLSTLQPICRKEPNWMAAQWRVLQDIRDIWIQANAERSSCIPIILAGDIFDTPCPDLSLIRMFRNWAEACSEEVYTIPGQHDLLHHRISSLSETGYGFAARRDLCGLIVMEGPLQRTTHRYPRHDRDVDPYLELDIHGSADGPGVYGFGWDQCHEEEDAAFFDRVKALDESVPIAILHEYVHAGGKTQYEGATKDCHARKLAKRFNGFQFVFCGDNHTPFEYRPAVGPMIINCGALQCRTIKQRDFVPSVILLCQDLKKNKLVPVRINLPVNENVWAPLSVLTLLEKHQAALIEFKELSTKENLTAQWSLENMLRHFLAQTKRSGLESALQKLLAEVAG